MRSIQVLGKKVLGKKVLGKKVTGWQLLPADAEDFEQAALHACELVLAGDVRIGKVPGARRSSARKAVPSPQQAKPPKKSAKARSRS